MQWQMAQALGRCAEMRSLQSILNELWVPPVPHPRRAPLDIVCARRGHSAQSAAPGGSSSFEPRAPSRRQLPLARATWLQIAMFFFFCTPLTRTCKSFPELLQRAPDRPPHRPYPPALWFPPGVHHILRPRPALVRRWLLRPNDPF